MQYIMFLVSREQTDLDQQKLQTLSYTLYFRFRFYGSSYLGVWNRMKNNIFFLNKKQTVSVLVLCLTLIHNIAQFWNDQSVCSTTAVYSKSW